MPSWRTIPNQPFARGNKEALEHLKYTLLKVKKLEKGPMEKKNVRRRYFNAAIITLVAAVLIMGGVFGGIYAKDQVDMDVRTLTTSIRIAEALRANVILDEGFIVIKRPGRSGGKSIAIPTMRRASHKEKIVQVSFQSLFFRKTMDFEKTDALKMPPPAAE